MTTILGSKVAVVMVSVLPWLGRAAGFNGKDTETVGVIGVVGYITLRSTYSALITSLVGVVVFLSWP